MLRVIGGLPLGSCLGLIAESKFALEETRNDDFG